MSNEIYSNYFELILKYLDHIYYVKLSFCLGFNKKIGLNSSIYKYFYNQNSFDINLIPLINITKKETVNHFKKIKK
jgi:hypothetical protein